MHTHFHINFASTTASTLPDNDFFSMLVDVQKSTRFDDQRSAAPAVRATFRHLYSHFFIRVIFCPQPGMFASGDNAIEEEFFDMLVLMQGSRIDDQRAGKAGISPYHTIMLPSINRTTSLHPQTRTRMPRPARLRSLTRTWISLPCSPPPRRPELRCAVHLLD